MIRQTSIDVYRQIEAEGLLSRLRWEVYKVLFEKGPLSQTDSYLHLTKSTKKGPQSYAPRFAELKNLGVIEEVGEKICSTTGRNVLIWDVTDRLPIKFEKPHREKCKVCNGKGYIETMQGKLL
jgi:hypothetical protein